MSEVDDTIKRIQSNKGVLGVLIMDWEGRPVRSTLDNETTSQYCTLLQPYADKSKALVRELDPTNDLTFVRLRSKKHELMIAPDKDYLLIVIQNPNA